MKKIVLIFFLLFFSSCVDYKPNYQINNRKPPIIIIAIDSGKSKSVLMRDGDNHVFTIYDNATTQAITKSLKVGDTLRLPQVRKSVKKKF